MPEEYSKHTAVPRCQHCTTLVESVKTRQHRMKKDTHPIVLHTLSGDYSISAKAAQQYVRHSYLSYRLGCNSSCIVYQQIEQVQHQLYQLHKRSQELLTQQSMQNMLQKQKEHVHKCIHDLEGQLRESKVCVSAHHCTLFHVCCRKL